MDPYSWVLSKAMKETILTNKVHPKKLKIENEENTKIEKDQDEFIMIVGFDRTGTTSIQAALAQLGYKCYSFNDAYRNYKHKKIWVDLLQQKYNKFQEFNASKSKLKSEQLSPNFNDWTIKTMIKYDWNELFNGYNGCCGSPSIAFFLEIKAHFHGRFKIILSIRDNGEAWYKSMMMTWHKYLNVLSSPLFRISLKYSQNYKFILYIYKVLFKIDYHDFKQEQVYMKTRYGEWKKFVKNQVYPPSKLLMYNCGRDGWKPLCKFLGKPIPSKSIKFPHRNQQNEWTKLIKSAHYAQRVALNLFIVIGIVLAFLIRYFYLQK